MKEQRIESPDVPPLEGHHTFHYLVPLNNTWPFYSLTAVAGTYLNRYFHFLYQASSAYLRLGLSLIEYRENGNTCSDKFQQLRCHPYGRGANPRPSHSTLHTLPGYLLSSTSFHFRKTLSMRKWNEVELKRKGGVSRGDPSVPWQLILPLLRYHYLIA